MNKKLNKQNSGKKYIALGTTFILIGLVSLDILFKGQIYQRLPNKSSKWIEKVELKCK